MTYPSGPMLAPTTTLNAMQEWETIARQLGKSAEQIITLQAQLDLVFANNGLAASIAAAEPGQPVDGSGYTREAAQAAYAMLESFKTWTQTPLEAAGGATPLQIIFRR